MQLRSKRPAIAPVYPGAKRPFANASGEWSDSAPRPSEEAKSKEEEQEAQDQPQPNFSLSNGGESLHPQQEPQHAQKHSASPAQVPSDMQSRDSSYSQQPDAKPVQRGGSQRNSSDGEPGAIMQHCDCRSRVGELSKEIEALQGAIADLQHNYAVGSDVMLRSEISDLSFRFSKFVSSWEKGGDKEGMLRKCYAFLKYCESHEKLPDSAWHSNPEVRSAYFNNLFSNTRAAASGSNFKPRPFNG